MENIFDYQTENITPSELDLNNPIFVYYINIGGLTRQRADETISQLAAMFRYKNATIWFVPRIEGETKIECIWDGSYKKREVELSNLIKELNSRVDILSNSTTYEDFKMNIRDWKIKDLFDGS